MDWQTIIAIGAIAMSAISILARAFDKSLSIREHEEFSKNVHRDTDRIERRIELIEQTRPTTGELEARLDSSRRGAPP
jgi:hypothetical protein